MKVESDWECEYEIQYIDCHEEQQCLYTVAVTAITIPTES